jgi:hypothetical protein
VRTNNQRLRLDLVLVGHGQVTGTVRREHATGGRRARSRGECQDSQIGIVTTTDTQGRYAVEE